MPVKVTRYRCKYCNRQYESHKAAKDCESGHLIPVSVKAELYTVAAYPYKVEVTFDSGERRIYNAEDLGG
ncbi:MAG: hypothetical protein LBL26_12130 [Peptococcaceae bacterium]|jgi:hypothetical protein|nr:hypothetical protein [Peptococcaceae bacterium]